MKKWLFQFDDLPLRLRLIITIGAIFILFSLIDLGWLSTTNNTIAVKEKEIMRTKSITQELIEAQNQYNQGIYSDRNDPKILRLNRLNLQLKKVRSSLKNHTLNLVQPEDMTDLLNTIIKSTDSLELQRLIKQKAMPLSDNDKGKENDKNRIKLFRHTLEIDLVGNYQATFSFLQKLENMDKKMAFDSFEYMVKDHPSGRIKLFVSTLSLQEEWIGG